MHINNISKKTSLENSIVLGISSIISTGFVVLLYFTNTTWSWIIWGGILLPSLYYAFISSIIERNKAIKEFNSNLNLKSVEFLQGKINFNFNRAQYNFACGYNDIKSLEMTVVTNRERTKYGYITVLKEIILNFTVLNNKTFTLSSPTSSMRLIYNIIDHTRGVNNFTYNFTGSGDTKEISKTIDNYLKTGLKQILSNHTEITCKYISITLFTIGCILLVTAKDTIEEAYKMNLLIKSWPFFILIIISFIIDIWLVADELRERKCRWY